MEIDARKAKIYNLGVALYIANAEADALARELAAKTGESITDVIIHALRERRARLVEPTREERLARIDALTAMTAEMLKDQTVDFDDLYDEWGLPT